MKKILLFGAIAFQFALVSCNNNDDSSNVSANVLDQGEVAFRAPTQPNPDILQAKDLGLEEIKFREDNSGQSNNSNVGVAYEDDLVFDDQGRRIYGAYLSVGIHCMYITWTYGPTGQAGIPSNTPGHSGTISYTIIYLGSGSSDSCKP